MQLQELSNIAKDDDGSIETINRLHLGNVIPFFESKKYWQVPANEWDKFLYQANTVPGDDNLAWITTNSEIGS